MINKEHKDRLYKMIFGNPEHRQWTLNLYNAVNGSNYDDPSQITYNTIGEVLYMGMRNDDKTMEIEDAVDQVLKDMPDSFGIKPYLISNREEVRMSILTEYDEAKTMACFKEEGREEGEDLLADVIKRIRNGETPEKIIASGVSPQTVEKAEDVVSLFS